MISAPLHLAGERLMLDPAGALVWPAQRLLAVADLHLEQEPAAAVRGSLLPPRDARVTFERLAALLRRHSPRTVVVLGESGHDPGGAVRLAAMAAATGFVWVSGNRDSIPPEGIGGVAVTEWRVGPLVFRHRAIAGAAGEISGHCHPEARLVERGAPVSRACFVADGRRVLLPALGGHTGGLDVCDPAIARLFPRGGRVFLLGRERLFSLTYAAVRAAGPVPWSGRPCTNGGSLLQQR